MPPSEVSKFDFKFRRRSRPSLSIATKKFTCWNNNSSVQLLTIAKVRKKAWFFSRNCEIGNTKSEILRDPVQAVFSREKCGPNSPPSHILIVTIFPGDFRMILWIKKPSRSVRYSRPPGEDLYFCHNLKFLNKSYLDRLSFIREVKIHKHSHNFASSS